MYIKQYAFRDKMPVYHYPLPLSPVKDEILNGKHLNSYVAKNEKGHNLYIHIPFCKSICSFCPYVKVIKEDKKVKEYINALKKEIYVYAKSNYIKNFNFTAVYFGGGTPSVLDIEQLLDLLNTVRKQFNISEKAEITVEGSPSSFDFNKLVTLKQNGVNRISMGVQTFDDDLAKLLELPQNSKTAKEVVLNSFKAGFKTVSLDLIYNIPGQSLEMWENDLLQAIELGVNQITLFPMAIVPFTKIFDLIKENKVKNIQPEDIEYIFYDMAIKILDKNGYKQKTNLDWLKDGTEYRYCEQHFAGFSDVLGIGTGAFGQINNIVYINTGVLPEYLQAINDGILPIKRFDNLEGEQLYKFVTMGLKGLHLSNEKFKNMFNRSIIDIWNPVIKELKEKNLIKIENENIFVTKLGSFYINNISKEFFSNKYKNRNPFEVAMEKLAREK